MINLLKKFIFLLLVIAVLAFILINNTTVVTVSFWPKKQMELGLGLVLVLTFVLGFLVSYLIASIISMKSYFKEYKLTKEKDKKDNTFKKILDAREENFLGDKDKAIYLWDSILRKNKNNALPYIEKARLYLCKGQFNDALNILEEAKKNSCDSLEVTFLIAKTHEKLGHDVSALENYKRIFEIKPSLFIASSARDIACKISQFDDALIYQKYIDNINKEKNSTIFLNISLLKIINEAKDKIEEKKEKLLCLHKEFPSHEKIALALSDILLKENNTKEATKVLTKLALNIKKAYVWRKIAKIWLDANEPQKAISAISSAKTSTLEEEKIKVFFAELEIFINLAMLDDARESFKKLEKHIQDNSISLSKDEQILLGISSAILFDNRNYKKLDMFDVIDK